MRQHWSAVRGETDQPGLTSDKISKPVDIVSTRHLTGRQATKSRKPRPPPHLSVLGSSIVSTRGGKPKCYLKFARFIGARPRPPTQFLSPTGLWHHSINAIALRRLVAAWCSLTSSAIALAKIMGSANSAVAFQLASTIAIACDDDARATLAHMLSSGWPRTYSARQLACVTKPQYESNTFMSTFSI